MDADLLPELSGETWVASALLDELTVDLPATGVGDDLVSDTKYYKQCGHGWNRELLHRGWSVPDCHRNFVVGDFK